MKIKKTSSFSATAMVRRFGALILFAGLMGSGGRAGAQGPGSLVWASGPDLPSPRAESVAVLAPDNAVLLLGGVSPAGTTVVPRLPNGAALWTTAPNLDTTRIAPGAVRFSTQGILVIGGRTGGEPTDEVVQYDYHFGDSEDVEKMSVGRQQFAFAADSAGRAYAVGGLGESPGQIFASAERYDPAQDVWTGIAPLPAARYGAAAVGVGGTHVYVFGGATTGGVQASAWRYSIAASSWETVAALPVAVRNAAAVLFQDRIYVMGGVSASGPVASVQVYDVSTGLWSSDTPLPAARYAHGAVLAASGRILVAGGYDAGGAAAASVYQSQQLNVPETAPVLNTTPVTTASLDRAYAYDAGAMGNPAPAFSLVSAPAGMGVAAFSGLIAWQPIAGQVGVHAVTLRASNRVGFAEQTFNITVVADTFAPTPPTEVHVVAVTSNSVELAWSGATDANGVDHYGVYRRYRCGFRGIRWCYALVQGNIPGTTTVIGGLPPQTSYTYAVRAFDAGGNASVNSPLVSFKTLSPPVSFRYYGSTTLSANFPLQLQFFASANPAATFSAVSGPPGLTVDAASGVATWTPSPADVGTHALMVRAENSGGAAELSVTLTVQPDMPLLSMQFIPGAGGARDAVAGTPWSARVLDGSHTSPAFDIVSAPAGMTIDAATGLLSWLPTADDAGLKSVTVRAVNPAGSSDILFEFYCHFTGPVTNLQVSGLTDLNPTATWSAPVGVGADRSAAYTIVATARYRYGRASRTQTLTYETEADNPAVVLTGLTAARTYTVYVNAVDEADNRGVVNSPGVSFVPRPALPTVSWSITNASGGTAVIAGEEAVVQLTDSNTGFGPTSYAIVSAPAGFTLDAVTGEGRWTPTAADIGPAPVIIRVTNQIGPRDVTINLAVYFSGPVRSAVATRTGDNAFASWSPPSDNAFPVASYRVTMHWQWSSRSYSRPMTTTDTGLAFALVPTGAVWHKGVTITPLDAAGRAGVPTALIPYNGALPVGLPLAEPGWIERLTVGADGIPVLEIRGPVGAVAEVEVSEDLSIWDPLETVTLGEDGVVLCPDPAGRNAMRGFYRLRLP